MNNLDFSIIDYKALINGIYLTIIISVVSAFLAFIIGSIWTYQRTSPKKKLPNGFQT